MNNPSSVLIGWLGLIAAGGTAYYLAKKDIDARRRAQEAAKTRPTEKLEWWQKIEQQESNEMNTMNNSGNEGTAGVGTG
ncbi:8948_t:CDS:2 [Diversispora eburnea]|uniref:8948_t:CDS:1 n=1 Tax=Diversispora eburnea TaxID=1213867 RepID=A0A9N9A6G6_9GLOM|nr:8948_t:CDS:2 [Diversispora eburnea]